MLDYGAIYTQMHRNEKAFPGYSIKHQVKRIAKLVTSTGAKRLLDYGCGKGYQYLNERVHERWGGVLPYCYDVGVRQLSDKPEGKFDGIICTDMLEHIAPEDVDDILADIFSFADETAFLFFAVSCRPSAKKHLPDGRNVHLCVREPGFWTAKIAKQARPGLIIETSYEGHEG